MLYSDFYVHSYTQAHKAPAQPQHVLTYKHTQGVRSTGNLNEVDFKGNLLHKDLGALGGEAVGL